MTKATDTRPQPIRQPSAFGRQLEQFIFRNRPFLLLFFILATILLAYQATKLRPDASFEKMIPIDHPFIKTFMKHADDLGAAGTTIQVVVENTNGDIFDPDYLETLQKINDAVFYLPGVDRNRMRSLWTPNVRWTEVTELGFEGDRVIDSNYDGSPEALETLRQNVLRSGEVGRLVADNYQSSMVQAPLFDRDPKTGEPLDYWQLSEALESEVREKYQSDNIKIHIVGFAKVIGDLLQGITSIFIFGVITLVITSILLFIYSRSASGTIAPLVCSVIAVIWQLGLLTTMGLGLNAYSILIPFLVFAIAVSHGVQVVNAAAIEMRRGATKEQAAQMAFRALYVPGMTALVSDAIGFITMLLIDIEVIQELGIAASVGVAAIILTNLVLLPILISYFGIGRSSINYMQSGPSADTSHWRTLSQFASRRVAPISILVASLGFVIGAIGGHNMKIGDLDPGAPELHPDSRYNIDNQFVTDNYATSSDVLVVMVETDKNQCSSYRVMEAVDRFTWAMENVPGVNSAMAATTVSKLVASGFNEGNLKWSTISRDQRALDTTFNPMPEALLNRECSLLPVALFLDDHKAKTLQGVIDAVQAFAASNNAPGLTFALAAGNSGIEAATNQEIASSQLRMLVLVYAVVCLLVFISFRSWRAVVCIVIPLMLTSALCQALMSALGIGVKVATLPVIALGVGVGVDYGIYIYSRLDSFLRQGLPIQEAYFHTLRTTGKAVCFTGIALAIGVATWIWSPIKFQADMGKLLTFMFLWNMVGAIWLLPALACYLCKPEQYLKQDQQAVKIL